MQLSPQFVSRQTAPEALRITAATVLEARRKLALKSIKWFARLIEIPGAPKTDANGNELDDETHGDLFHTMRLDRLALHHDILLDALQEVADGTLKYLIVIMPPGSAKSTYCSVVFPAWLMAKFEGIQVLLASYGDDLARKHGKKARQLVRSEGYQSLFKSPIRVGSNAADDWSMENGSQYLAGGLTTGITGNRCDVGICDDPIKGREAAESETQREKIEDTIRDDFESRVKPQPLNGKKGPRGARIYITTRWHMLDPVGKILPLKWNGESGDMLGQDGRMWRVICIPAQADRTDDPLGREIGEYLWPEWFGEDHWVPFKRHSRTWNSLYQGKPTPGEGNYFKSAWLHKVEKLPAKETLRVYGGSDYAVTDDGGDYTVHAVVGICPENHMYLLDLWREQTTSKVWVETFCALVKKHKPIGWAEETGQIKSSVGPFLVDMMQEKKAYTVREQFPTRGDKAIRCQSIRGRMEVDGLYVQKDAPFLPELEAELLTFPVGIHDDQADALGLVGQLLDKMQVGDPLPPTAPPPPPKDILSMSFDQILAMQEGPKEQRA